MAVVRSMWVAGSLIAAVVAGPIAAQIQPVQPAAGSAAASAGSAPVSNGGYVLGAGDRVRVIVFGEDRLSGEYVVTSTGEISFPLIGNIKVTGTTVADMQAAIRTRLAAGYVKDPRVSAEVLSFRPYYVLGEVARPGQYPYVEGLTLEQAIATAGGFTYRAKRKELKLQPARTDEQRKVNLRKEGTRLVQPGDTITVGERFF